MQQVAASQARPPFYRDERVLGVISQIVVVGIVLGLLGYFYSNMVSALRTQMGVAINYDFLRSTAGFDIGESLIPYSRASTYLQALAVGLLNTFQVAVLGIIFATLLGILLGIMRLSTNFLVNRIAAVYIDIFRNIPCYCC